MRFIKSLPVSQQMLMGENVVDIAHDLVGAVLVSYTENRLSAGIIAETEAYAGATDRASHAYLGKNTKRTESMFLAGGHTYVYLCYGIHKLFNIVTNKSNTPNAVLVRGLLPLDEKYIHSDYLPVYSKLDSVRNGPAKLTKALGIELEHDRLLLNKSSIWLFEKVETNLPEIISAPRVGVDYAGEDAKLLYRFYRSDYRPVKAV